MTSGEQPAEAADRSPGTGRAARFRIAAVRAAATSSRASQAVAAMLGLAGPVAAGALTGHAHIGALASLGGLALSGDGKGESFREQAPSLIYAFVATTVATFAGSYLSGGGLPIVFALPAVAAVAGLIGGISRPLARASTQFILFTVIAAHVGGGEPHPLARTALFSLGAAWTACLTLALRPLFRAAGAASVPETTIPPRYPLKRLLSRWRSSLTRFSGWQYPLRITLCLTAAEAFARTWPDRHGYWAAVTTAIVVHRDLRLALPRAFHRSVGTAFGVLMISLFLLASPPLWAAVAAIAVLALFRPLLLPVHYAAYAAVMTPLVILLLDFGQGTSWATVIDRLAATLVGCTLALTLGYLLWLRLLPKRTGPAPDR